MIRKKGTAMAAVPFFWNSRKNLKLKEVLNLQDPTEQNEAYFY